jgi:hypothetical protein
MKSSSFWSRVTLTAFAILLIGIKPRAARPEGNPNLTANVQKPQTGIGNPTASLAEPSEPTASSAPRASYVGAYKQSQQGNLAAWLQAGGTLGLLIFACWQIGFMRRSTAATENAARAASDNANASKDAAIATERYVEMTEQMAEAAKQSARAAELMLDSERPYVFVESQELRASKDIPLPALITGREGNQESRMAVTVSFALHNRGKGIALVNSLAVRLILATSLLSKERQRPRRVQKSRSGELDIRVIGPDKWHRHETFGLTVCLVDWQEIQVRSLRLLILGIVHYQDVFRRRFWTRFCFEYRPQTTFPAQIMAGLAPSASPITLPGFLIIGPDGTPAEKAKHNQYT